MDADQIFNRMLEKDAFSRWLGVECLEIGPGFCILRMRVRSEMLNGFLIAHGGVTFSLADSAFAFASNSRGKHAVSIETSISHTAPVREGDWLTATAAETHLSPRIGIYSVEVRNQEDQIVALFKGTVYRKKEEWENPASL